MTPASSLTTRVGRLERRLKIAVAGWVLTVGVGLLGACPGSDLTTDTLRVRALIVTDSAGRERIVLGAPVPDLAAGRRESPANGLIVLNEQGRDQLAIGSPKPNPQILGRVGRRISPSTGFQFNEPNGDERGGFGFMENGRVTFGIDWAGAEAITMAVRPEGPARMRVAGQNRRSRALFGTLGSDSVTLLMLLDRDGTERVRLGVPEGGAAGIERFGPREPRLESRSGQ